MRHRKHNHQLGVKTAHRAALLSNLAAALLRHGRIKTTLAKAKALRPFVEKNITLAKKAQLADDRGKALHYRREVVSRIRDTEAVGILFNDRVHEFLSRNGGYTRIYKLAPRVGDAADMALIELIPGDDEGYPKKRKPARKKKASAKQEAPAEADSAEAETASAEAGASAEAAQPAAADAATEGETEPIAASESGNENQPGDEEKKKG